MANGDAGDMASYNAAQLEVVRMLREIRAQGYAVGRNFPVGRIENRMKIHAELNNVQLHGASLYMGPKTIFHSQRPSKVKKNLHVPEYGLADFVKTRRNMDLYWDGECYIYTDHKYKYIVNPNYELKINRNKKRKVSFVTAGRVTDDDDFNNPKYTKI